VFENRVLRRIFGPKWGKVRWGWRKLQKEELHDLYSSPCIIRITNAYRLLVGKPERKRPLRRPKRRWRNNIKMDLLEIGLGVLDWIGLAQDRYRWRALVIAVMNLRVT
jgi:hypothetical protein